MSTIHGASTKAIALFRDNPAALAVYWIYCARRNHDGVSFPSLRGLSHDTGWSVNPCRDARDWLVEHGALEKIEKYVRPQWQKLPEKERVRRVNFDRSEYYKVTGQIVLGDKSHKLLYAPSDDSSDVSSSDTSPDDVSHGLTSHGDEHAHGDTELDSLSDLDSQKGIELGSSSNLDAGVENASAAAADPAQKPTPISVEEKLPPLVVVGTSPNPPVVPPSPEQIGALMTLYTENIAPLTPLAKDDLLDLMTEHGVATVDYAIHEANEHNKRNLAYIKSVVEAKAAREPNGTLPAANDQREPIARKYADFFEH